MSSPEGFQRVLDYLEDKLSFESDYYSNSYLDRRITSLMRRTESDTHREYLQILEADQEERDALLDALSITVTNFFRNPEVWAAIRPLLRSLTEEQQAVSVWSAPCADGREPYSLAMLALDDPQTAADCVEIIATDINPDVLEVAREGIYRSTQTTDIEEELSPLDDYSHYLDREGDRFAVRPPVKGLVSFSRHDLIREPPPEEFDLVLCRNLLIYIDAEYKLPIFTTLLESLREGGYLVIGMTETVPKACEDELLAVDKGNRIYQKC